MFDQESCHYSQTFSYKLQLLLLIFTKPEPGEGVAALLEREPIEKGYIHSSRMLSQSFGNMALR